MERPPSGGPQPPSTPPPPASSRLAPQAGPSAVLETTIEAVSRSTSPEEVAHAVLEGAMAALGADWGLIALLDATGRELILHAGHGLTPDMQARWKRWSVDAPMPGSGCIRTGSAYWLETPEAVAAQCPDLARSDLVRPRALAGLPLVLDGRSGGALVLGFAIERRFPPADREILFTLGALCAQALARARLFAAEHEARLRAEQLADRFRRLQALGDELSPPLPFADLAGAIVKQGMAAAEAQSGALWIVEGEKAQLRHQEGAASWPAEPVALEDPTLPVAVALRTGEPVWQEPAIVTLPLVSFGRALGGLALGFAEPRPADRHHREFLILLARHAAQALDRRALVAAREREATRQTFLAEVSGALAGSLDIRQTLDGIAALAVPAIADWCIIDLVAPDGMLDRVAIRHADPDKAEVARSLPRRFAQRPELAHSVSQAIAQGEALLLRELTDDILREVARDPQHLAALRAIEGRSLVSAPLGVGGRAIGALTLISCCGAYDEPDRQLAVALAQRAAVALENARLYSEQRRALRRLVKLQEVTSLLSKARTTDEVATITVRLAADAVDASSCALWTSNRDGTLELLASHRVPDDFIGDWTRIPPDADVPAQRVLQSGEPLWVESEAAYRDASPALAERARAASRLNSFAVLPLAVPAERIGIVAFSYEGAHGFSADEKEYLLTLTQQSAQALDRARLYESEARARRQAEDASRAKDEFLAMLGHELRNPLAPMLTALQLMRLRGGAELERERQVLERQTRHLVRLVDDLMDVSRITRGKVELRRQLVEIASVVARAIEIASPLIEQRAQHLEVAVPPQGMLVDADPARLAQVLANLLTNAAKYTPSGGRVEVSATRQGSQIELRVRDDGIGIAPELLPRIFDLFVQGERSSDRSSGGLGLGLAIVKSLVQLHAGQVSAQSEGLGRGTTFVVLLPAAAARRLALVPEEAAPQRTDAPSLRVLVVDDNVDAADMLGEILRELGHEVRVAHDGPAALVAASDFEPHLALLDIGLPVMDGYELGQRLRSLPGLEHTRLVAVTGYGQPSDRERSRRAGFDDHVVKPLLPDTVNQLLDPLLRRAGAR